ncbi:MAG TPA: inner membrane CreD family protein [Blastocatellia bacterium]|nr:inner membrane CreD family protein [Blastocatellia bacterium]HMX24675.1 inner membrane CreD family protein [Blastocatellia bacterium]HMY73073.1 inner membrane CreD family protein [Blastocatellia bacterium]HNG30116.1 inner membrane CreD family protein [Blastocatellia bacterium]
MVTRIAAIVAIYACTAMAWMILGSTVDQRTGAQDESLKQAVSQLWGTAQRQRAPQAYYQTHQQTKVQTQNGAQIVSEFKTETTSHPLLLDGSDITVNLNLGHRKKGLLWYSTYRVGFAAKYRVVNYTDEPREIFFDFAFPTATDAYDNFRFVIGGREEPNLQVVGGKLSGRMKLDPGKSEIVEVGYQSQGLDEWWYDFGENVNQAKNFSLAMTTNFDQIDFPPSSISPTKKEQTAGGWQLNWQYSSLLSGVKIGMAMPHKLNPGPWVSRVTYSAPVSLFLFFFVVFILTTIKKVKLHPMNYFFVGAAYFSFHLLLAYLVDHVSIHAAFFVCSAVSIGLVVSYMRLVVGTRFALVEVGLMQFVYLVLFSYTYFFEAFTGLAITILCIITLFVVMQFTGKMDWETLFRKQEAAPLTE